MSVLGKAYLGVSLIILTFGLIWFALVLHENRNWVEVVMLVPNFDFGEPMISRSRQMNVASILAGWGACVSVLLLAGIWAPFRIRGMALLQRRLRELEREVLELRTLPLRQHEDDELLAAEAHLDIRAKKVMTEKLRRDRMLQDGESGIEHGDLARDLARDSARDLAPSDSGVGPIGFIAPPSATGSSSGAAGTSGAGGSKP